MIDFTEDQKSKIDEQFPRKDWSARDRVLILAVAQWTLEKLVPKPNQERVPDLDLDLRNGCTYSRKDVVAIKVCGDKTADTQSKSSLAKYGPLPPCPADRGLIERMMRFVKESGIMPVIFGGSIYGRGWYISSFTREDAEKIEKWIIENESNQKSD